MNREISKVVHDIKPDIVYTHFLGDLNDDHTIISKATLVATRPPFIPIVYAYETLSETEWGMQEFKPNYWVDIGKFMLEKIKAFKIYKSEVKKWPHPRSSEGIKILAKKRGSESGLRFAEAFILIKNIWT